MSRNSPLNELAETTLDANGNGAVELKPTAYNETWLVTSCATKVSSNTNEPEFEVFNSGQFIDGTTEGSRNSTGMYEIVQTNQPIRGEWTAGDAGAIAQMRLGGIRMLG